VADFLRMTKNPPAISPERAASGLAEQFMHNIPGMGTLPARPGTVLLEEDKQRLRKLGWNDGDPLPPDMAQRIAQARAEIERDIQSGQLQGIGNIPPLKVPKEVPLDQLPVKQRQELAAYLASYKTQAPALAEAQAKHQAAIRNMAGLDPSVVQAIQTAQGPPVKGFFLTDSRSQPAAQPAIPAIPAMPATPVLQATQEELLVEKPKPKFTELDKANYVISVLAGNKSFRKEYSFLGGRLRVIYRDPPVGHFNLLIKQAAEDDRRSLPGLLASDYRCALFLDQIILDNEVTDVGAQVDQFLREHTTSEKNTTTLPELVEAMQRVEPFNKNALWSLFLGGVRRFIDLTNDLEASASDPDF
jgi:hypothetical protein